MVDSIIRAVMGAKARLLKQHGVPYSNPVYGQTLEIQFTDEIAKLEIQRFRAF